MFQLQNVACMHVHAPIQHHTNPAPNPQISKKTAKPWHACPPPPLPPPHPPTYTHPLGPGHMHAVRRDPPAALHRASMGNESSYSSYPTHGPRGTAIHDDLIPSSSSHHRPRRAVPRSSKADESYKAFIIHTALSMTHAHHSLFTVSGGTPAE